MSGGGVRELKVFGISQPPRVRAVCAEFEGSLPIHHKGKGKLTTESQERLPQVCPQRAQ